MHVPNIRQVSTIEYRPQAKEVAEVTSPEVGTPKETILELRLSKRTMSHACILETHCFAVGHTEIGGITNSTFKVRSIKTGAR